MLPGEASQTTTSDYLRRYREKRDQKPTTSLAERGLTSLWMQNLKQAVIEYTRSREIDFYYLQNHNNWMAIWSGMCYEIPDVEVIERLEILATTDPEAYAAFVCRGVAKWLRRNFDEALQELEQ